MYVPFLRLAIKYIRHLQYLLSFPPNQKIPGHIVEFDPSLPAWIKGKNLPGAISIVDIENSAAVAAATAAAHAAAAGASPSSSAAAAAAAGLNGELSAEESFYLATGQRPPPPGQIEYDF